MFSVVYNCGIKSSKHWKPPRKNIKYQTLYWSVWLERYRFSDWNKRLEKERNNKTIALNILSVPHNKETINLKCKSKYNQKRENQVILLIITNSEK